MNRLSVSTLLASTIWLSFPSLSHAQPALFYSDVISGPNTGGEGDAGVFVRIFGKRLGTARGASTVTIGGGEAASYPLWTDSEIAFQLGPNAQTGSIVVNTALGASNPLPFTVRAGRIFFVDASSPNDPGSGTFADPWRSPQSFYDSAAAGDTVYIRAGTYSGTYGYSNGSANLVMRRGTGSGYTADGTEAMPIAWLGYPGETALFSAPGPTGNLYNVRGYLGTSTDRAPDWIVIGNLSFLAYNSCVSAGGTSTMAHGWRIVGNECEGLTRTTQLQSGAIVPGGNYSKVLGNTIHGGRTGDKLDHAVYSMSCSLDVEIAWNHIYDNNFASGPLISVNYESNRCAAGQYAGVASVHDNIVDATSYPSRCHYTYDQSYTDGDPVIPVTKVFNNVFINCGGPGADGALVMRNGGMEAYNNTFYNTRTYCLEISGPTVRIAYLNFKNNICHMMSTATSYTRYESDAPVRDAEKNIYFGLGGYSGTMDVAPINADPLFVDPGAGDFHLQATSPAIDAGAGSVASVVTTDFDGNARPQDGVFDIGAFELVPNCAQASDCLSPPRCRVAAGATCNGTVCSYPPAASTTACEDGDSCTTGDQCDGAGACLAGANVCPACSDSDGDGYGDPASVACTQAELDCDDGDVAVHPNGTESCNTVDDNCDGAVDEGCSCNNGDSRSCYGGPAGTEGAGACRAGTQSCTNGSWEACSGQVVPTSELCGDGVDGDCDAIDDATDADCANSPCADADGDGHANAVCGGDDCNDSDPAVYACGPGSGVSGGCQCDGSGPLGWQGLLALLGLLAARRRWSAVLVIP